MRRTPYFVFFGVISKDTAEVEIVAIFLEPSFPFGHQIADALTHGADIGQKRLERNTTTNITP